MDNKLSKLKNRSPFAHEHAAVLFPRDIEAFTRIYRQHFPGLCEFANWYTENRITAEDIVHDVFFNIWKNQEKMSTIGSIRSYLYTAVKNRAINFTKHQRLEKQWLVDSSRLDSQISITPEDHLLAVELYEKINSVIHRLPAHRKRIFSLSRDHGLSYKEIADILDISVKTVETQISRTLSAIRKELKGYL